MNNLDILTSPEQFAIIKDLWDRFVDEHCPEAYYLNHEWLTEWWACYAREAKVVIVLVQDGGRLRGVAPFCVRKGNFGGFPVRELRVLGTGFGNEDFALPAARPELLVEIFRAVGRKEPWDIAHFPRLTPGWAETLEEAARQGKWKMEAQGTLNPIIELRGGYEAYFNSRSKNFRANFRKKTKRVNSWGTSAYTVTTGEDLPGLIATVEEVGAESWQGDQGVCLSATAEGRKFLNAMLANFARRGVLDLTFLSLDDKVIAYLLGARIGKTYFAIETAYKQPYFDASPGMLLHLNVIERLFGEDRLTVLNFGYDAEYKRKWTELNRPEKSCVLFNRRPYPVLIRLLRGSKFYNGIREWRRRRKTGKAISAPTVPTAGETP